MHCGLRDCCGAVKFKALTVIVMTGGASAYGRAQLNRPQAAQRAYTGRWDKMRYLRRKLKLWKPK